MLKTFLLGLLFGYSGGFMCWYYLVNTDVTIPPIVVTKKIYIEQPCMSLAQASWYGSWHHGKTMANGEPFDMHALTVASRTHDLGAKLVLSYEGAAVVVTVTDRGPYVEGRQLDVSKRVAEELGFVEQGIATVAVREI